MATHRPIVITGGRLRQLPNGDRSYGAGCVPLRILAGDYFHVPENNQALYSQPIVLDDGAQLILDGMLVETA